MNRTFYKNHLINKKLGQIFLKDKKIINTIIKIINLKKEHILIEIGPGLGALTKKIIKFVEKLTIIEIDNNLSNILKKHFKNQKNIHIIQKDIIEINLHQLANQIGKPLRIIGNLPYNLSTKIIFHLFKYSDIIYDMHFMFQKEVAQRLVATPNNKYYGKLSVIAQYYCDITTLLEIEANSFIPQPKVHSTLLKLTPYHINNNPYPQTNTKILSIISKIAFNQRRKTIKNSLKSVFTPKELKKYGIHLQSRAENLNIKQFCHLANSIKTTILNNKNLPIYYTNKK